MSLHFRAAAQEGAGKGVAPSLALSHTPTNPEMEAVKLTREPEGAPRPIGSLPRIRQRLKTLGDLMGSVWR